MSYGKVHDVYWEDDKIELLSDRAALLGLFLITGIHRNAIGCFKIGVGAITDNPRFGEWGIEGVSIALQELIDVGFIVRDQRTGWTFIRNALKHDPINGPKAAVHAAMLATKVPRNTEVYEALKEKLEPQIEAYHEALSGKPGYPMANPTDRVSEGYPIPKPSPLPSPSPLPEPSPGTKGCASAPPAGYAFSGKVISLKGADFDQWCEAFADGDQALLRSWLQQRDDWLASPEAESGRRKKWFVTTSNWLAAKSDERKGNGGINEAESMRREERIARVAARLRDRDRQGVYDGSGGDADPVLPPVPSRH